MALKNLFGKLSESPTLPPPVEKQPSEFDVGSLYEGPVSGVGDRAGGVDADLREKLRQAYLWIVNYAI
ncbi:MAG: ATPase, partial [Acidobacteria bacterium]|nr:ATPase [Acidobacteriota bacterium]